MRKKTVEELKTAGTYRADRHATREPAGDLLKALPPAPFTISREATEIYQGEGLRLIEQRMLKATDILPLAAYSVEMSIYIAQNAAALEEGVVVTLPNGINATSAHRKAAETALKNAAALADKLGLTPASRARLRGESAFKDDKPKEESLLFQLMQGGITVKRPTGEAAGGSK